MMMLLKETQTIELKKQWDDEYLKTICAFLNTDGGTMYIGVEDNGQAFGVKNIKKDLEDLPNKIMNFFTIPASVEIVQYQDKDIIKIAVSRSPIHSYQGKFYYRVGSTTQELKGTALQRLLLEVNNLTWDGTCLDSATMDDIDMETVKRFVEMATSENRLPAGVDGNDVEKLFRNLNLISKDGKLTRASVLLFGKKPVQFFHSATFKIGRFGVDSTDLIVHDLVEDNLFKMFDKVLDLLKSKYLWSPVRYDGMRRVELLEIPEKALRETILNALIHKDYTSHSSISIRVYDSRITVWNDGELDKLSVDDLRKEHDSHKRNPLLADIFYRAGYIEAWGRGTNTIIEESVKSGLDEPTFSLRQGGLEVSFKRNPMRLADKGTAERPPLSMRQQLAVNWVYASGNISNKIYQKIAEISRQTATRELQNLVDAGILRKVGKGTKGITYALVERDTLHNPFSIDS
jgi:ATP-dependent DNA helicase RecG